MKVAVVGATGLVGSTMLSILEERNFPVDEIRYFASARSAGTTLKWKGADIVVEDAAIVDVALGANGPCVGGLHCESLSNFWSAAANF